jgi:hypothetical protein
MIALCVSMSFAVLSGGAALAQGEPTAIEPPVIDAPPQSEPPVIDAPPQSAESPLLPPPIGALEQAKPLRLLFRSPTKGVSFHLRLGATYRDVPAAAARFGLDYHSMGYSAYSGEVATGYAPICETPCVATLFPGTHRMALALNEGHPLDVERAVHLTTDSVVEGRYVDKRRMRRAGAMFGLVSMVAGTVMILVAADFQNRRGINYPVLYSGVGLLSVGIAVGLPLSMRRDEVSIEVYPLEP